MKEVAAYCFMERSYAAGQFGFALTWKEDMFNCWRARSTQSRYNSSLSKTSNGQLTQSGESRIFPQSTAVELELSRKCGCLSKLFKDVLKSSMISNNITV